jgi:DNA-binding GntR family transcriptional regulator
MAGANTTYQQQAYAYVKKQITNLGLKPGEYITDSQIAGTLKISRTPVREAFHRLENEGLLNYEARRGWKVYALSLHDINEIFDIKIAVEGLVARKAAECDDEALRAKLRTAVQQMRESAEGGDIEAWLQADVQLHEIIFAMADNDRAERIIQNLNDQWHRVRVGFVAMQSRLKRSIGEHEAIAESILARQGEEAQRQMETHLDQVREELVRLLVNMVLPFVENGV